MEHMELTWGEWKCNIMALGVPSVTEDGATLMLELHASKFAEVVVNIQLLWYNRANPDLSLTVVCSTQRRKM